MGRGVRGRGFDLGRVMGFLSKGRAAEQLAAYGEGDCAGAIQSFLFSGRLEDHYERGAIDSATFRALVRERCRLVCDDAQFDAAYADRLWTHPRACKPLPLRRCRRRLLLLSLTTYMISRPS